MGPILLFHRDRLRRLHLPRLVQCDLRKEEFLLPAYSIVGDFLSQLRPFALTGKCVGERRGYPPFAWASEGIV
jgi:hypothetical protein